MPQALFCAACRMLRPVAELLAFWPLGSTRTRFVCRPSLQRSELPPCFREVVGSSATTGIAFAVDVVAVGAAA